MSKDVMCFSCELYAEHTIVINPPGQHYCQECARQIRLEQQLKEANAVIDFYADKDNWMGSYSAEKKFPRMWKQSDIYEYDGHFKTAGKRAREYKKKWGLE